MIEFTAYATGVPVFIRASESGEIISIHWRQRKRRGRVSFLTAGAPIPQSLMRKITPGEMDRLSEEAQIEALGAQAYAKEITKGY